MSVAVLIKHFPIIKQLNEFRTSSGLKTYTSKHRIGLLLRTIFQDPLSSCPPVEKEGLFGRLLYAPKPDLRFSPLVDEGGCYKGDIHLGLDKGANTISPVAHHRP